MSIYSRADYYIQFKAIDYFSNISESEAHKIAYTNTYQDPVILRISSMETYTGDTLTLHAMNTGSDLSKILVTMNNHNCEMISNGMDTIDIIVPVFPETDITAQLRINVNGVKSEITILNLLNRFVLEDIGLEYRSMILEALDFDKDGYMDLLTGSRNGHDDIKLWKNINGDHYEYYGNVGNIKLNVNEFEVTDLNNDGYVDIVVNAGNETGEYRVYIYQSNQQGDFSLHNQTFQGFNTGGLAAGDLNNDGSMDIAGVGWSDELGDDSYILLNNDGSFSQGENLFNGKEVEVFDFDKDYDIDLFYANGGENIIAINNGSTYEFLSLTNIEYMDFGEIELFDLENDGDIDFYHSGYDYDISASNGGLFTMTQIGFESGETSLSPIYWGELLSGDFDNNGFTDLFCFGESENNIGVGAIYNNQEGINLKNINADVMDVRNASGVLFDMDNDGDLDLLVSGWGVTAQEEGSWFYRNERVKKNTNPTPPDYLTTFVFRDSVNFAWTPSSDKETNSEGLFYNLRVGTTPDGDDIMPGHAIVETGKLLKPYKGNASQNLGWKLKDLEVGKYYCAVQAIDPAYGASKFSEAHEFEIHYEADISLHVMVQDSIYPGAQISGVAIVGNPGLENINESFNVNTYFSVDQIADPSEVIDILEFPALPSGVYDTIAISMNISLDHPIGSNYIIFEIDPENNVTEFREDNNQVIELIIIKQDITPPVIDLSICDVEYSPIDTIVDCKATIFDNVKLEQVFFRYSIQSELSSQMYHLLSSTRSSVYAFDIERPDISSTDNYYIQFKATDYFGNVSESDILEIKYTYDTKKPEISALLVPDNYMMGDTLIEVSCKAVDNSFIKRVEAKFFDQGDDTNVYSGTKITSSVIDRFVFHINRTKIADRKPISVFFEALDYFNNKL